MPTIDPDCDKQDLQRAFDYCMGFFTMWHKEGRLRDSQLQAIAAYYESERKRLESGQSLAEPTQLPSPTVCWSCRKMDSQKDGYCLDCGAPLQSDEVQRLRYLVCLCHEIRKHETAGRIGYQTMHDLLREGN